MLNILLLETFGAREIVFSFFFIFLSTSHHRTNLTQESIIELEAVQNE